jgi:hypothetical protein
MTPDEHTDMLAKIIDAVDEAIGDEWQVGSWSELDGDGMEVTLLVHPTPEAQ